MAKVFITDYDYKADLLFHKEEYDYNAKGDERWYFVDNDYQATIKIFFVDYDYQADLKIFPVEYDYQAKWNTQHPLQNRLD